MSFVNHLLASRTPLELAKDLAATAKENAALRQRAYELEIELFWLQAAEREAPTGCNCPKETPCAPAMCGKCTAEELSEPEPQGFLAVYVKCLSASIQESIATIDAAIARRTAREQTERAGTRRCTDKED